MKRLLAVLLACLLLVTGCAKTEKKLESAVENYNNNLSLALKRQDPELMTRLTSPREKIRIKLYIEYLTKEKKQILDAKLKNLSFEKPEVDGDKATVQVLEDWSYSYLDVETRKEVKAPKDQNYQSTYYLVKNNKQGWVVDAVDIGLGNPNLGPYGTSGQFSNGGENK